MASDRKAITSLQARYRPADDEGEEFARRLHEVIVWALRQLGEQAGHQVALGVADLLDRGKWRLMTDINVGPDGQPLPETLWYRVEVEFPPAGRSWSRPTGRRSASPKNRPATRSSGRAAERPRPSRRPVGVDSPS